MGLRYSSKFLSPYSRRMPTPVKAIAIPATKMDLMVTVSSLCTSSKFRMAISRLTTVFRVKIELNNNKWEFIMENHKLHIWFHRVQTMVKFFLIVKYRYLKFQDSHKYKVRLASSISNMAWWELVLTTPWWLTSSSR